MNRLFNMDNGIFRALSKAVDCLYLSFIFVITCLPIFTIGTSITAMYYTVQKVLRHDRGYVASEYWHSFKTNFKQGTIVWLIVLASGLLLFFDMKILQAMDQAGHALGKTYVFFGVLLLFEALWVSYLFPYMARFENNLKAIMKNAALIAIMNLPRTLLILVLMVVFGLLLYLFMPLSFFVVPAVYTWLKNLILEKVFRKYMREEDIAAEEEMNREYKN